MAAGDVPRALETAESREPATYDMYAATFSSEGDDETRNGSVDGEEEEPELVCVMGSKTHVSFRFKILPTFDLHGF
jgi:hypothetical protein